MMFAPIPQIQVEALRDLVGKKPLIIDVSDASVYNTIHVPHATNVPLKTLLNDPQTYLTKDAYLICETGNKSKKAVSKLFQKYPVQWVKGGTIAYGRRFPLIRQQKLKEKAK
jgi:rhodanese-related sulfurtransferase